MKTRTLLKISLVMLLVIGSPTVIAAAIGGERHTEPLSPSASVDAPAQAATNEVITLTLPGDVPLAMVRIPGGTYLMGSTEEPGSSWNTCEWEQATCDKPAHAVTIDYDFYIGKYEVTQEQWEAVMGNNPTNQKNCPQCPVWNVSWDDTHDFTNALNKLGLGLFRLPSEAEWQYAARAGTTTRFYFGNGDACTPVDLYKCDLTTDPCPELSQHAWWGYAPAGGQPRPVGQKLPNPWGLYDIYGNVYEWCEDDWLYPFDSYGGAPTDGSPWLAATPTAKKVTLGSWRGYCDPAHYRSAYRTEHLHDMRHDSTGLRLVRKSDAALELHGVPADRAIRLTWEVNATLPPTATWRIDYYTQTATIYTVTDPYSTTRSLVLTEHVQNYRWYTVTLNTVDVTPVLSDTVRVMPTNIFVYLPLTMRNK
ncbi:MAG TPA: formylglycine-generating enzyme family protein [Anaerolineae bacterium]|nr:formylglycine-generating enzyme family protein [Anaerolineae bacterium]HQH39848.1 formylglycine-generating enzyme family protein [Anaerolineae bacterium]